jgi:predicted sugar kinase
VPWGSLQGLAKPCKATMTTPAATVAVAAVAIAIAAVMVVAMDRGQWNQTEELICCSHFNRVIGYMRPYDYALGAGVASMGPILFHLMEKMHPSHSGAKALKTNYRFVAFLGITAGFLRAYMESSSMLFPFW